MDLLEHLDDAAHAYLDKSSRYERADDYARQEMRDAWVCELNNLQLVRLLQAAIDKELSK